MGKIIILYNIDYII